MWKIRLEMAPMHSFDSGMVVYSVHLKLNILHIWLCAYCNTIDALDLSIKL